MVMSIQTNFPDVIVFPDGTIRLVTRAAKDLAYANTNIAKVFALSSANAVPDYLMFDETIPEIFEDEGFTVKWERQPVGHYRGKRRLWPKASNRPKVIKFLERIPDEYRKSAANRAYARFRQRHHEMQKAAQKCRKSRQYKPGIEER